MPGIPGKLPVSLVLLLLAPAISLGAPVSRLTAGLTLEAALTEARRANATLPVARQQVNSAMARVGEARGEGYKLSLDGDLHGGSPQDYASNDSLLQLSVQTPIYDGGQRAANIAQRLADVEASRAGYRMAARDVDFAVRLAFGQILRDTAAREFQRRGVTRLRAYLAVVKARQAAGQGVTADVLKIRQRIATALAELDTTGRGLHEARMELNNLLGREPDSTLVLAGLPMPTPPQKVNGQPWLDAPDVAQSAQAVRAGEAALRATRGSRRPQISLEANVGNQHPFGQGPAPLNNGTGSGGEVLLNFRLPLWDRGVYRSRVAAANAELAGARDKQQVIRRSARLAWQRAASDLDDLYNEYQARQKAVSVARDAWLQAESVYRGGQGTALGVLDAYDAWMQASRSRLEVIYNYRVAKAQLARWGAR